MWLETMNIGEIRQIKELLTMFGAKPNNDLGQNFLVEQKYLDQIVDAAEPLEGEKVLEIGPGMGVLTRELTRRAKEVTAIEVDPKMVEILKTLCIKCTNLTVRTMDILQFDPTDFGPYKIIANVPYYITSKILRKFLEEKNKPKEMVLLVQKEVAERICATPNRMSVLSVSVQYYGNPKLIGIVPREAFYPTPQVSSAIIKITTYKTPIFSDVDSTRFFALVKSGFGEKRKQLANSLLGFGPYEKEEVIGKLKAAGINPERRAETLSLAEWRTLYKQYYR
jgi:16S rRNA (adenine1518-N6/adenine1519-N6)-dimethyltransferase